MTPQQILEKITIGHVGIDTDDISLGKLASLLSDLTNRIEKLEMENPTVSLTKEDLEWAKKELTKEKKGDN